MKEAFVIKIDTGQHVGHVKFVCLIQKMGKCSRADVPRNVKQNHTAVVVKQSRISNTSINLQSQVLLIHDPH